jgi:hypothetical protein
VPDEERRRVQFWRREKWKNMEPSVPLHNLINEVERKIGRNVLLFQRLEAVLKFMLTHGNHSSYVSDIQAHHERKLASIGKQSLGQLVGQFNANVLSSSGEIPNEPKELKDAWFSLNFKVTSDSSFRADLEKSLGMVVAERNELIHHLLPRIDLTSTHGARAAIEYLDQQHEKALRTYSQLEVLATDLLDLRQTLAEYCASNEGV